MPNIDIRNVFDARNQKSDVNNELREYLEKYASLKATPIDWLSTKMFGGKLPADKMAESLTYYFVARENLGPDFKDEALSEYADLLKSTYGINDTQLNKFEELYNKPSYKDLQGMDGITEDGSTTFPKVEKEKQAPNINDSEQILDDIDEQLDKMLDGNEAPEEIKSEADIKLGKYEAEKKKEEIDNAFKREASTIRRDDFEYIEGYQKNHEKSMKSLSDNALVDYIKDTADIIDRGFKDDQREAFEKSYDNLLIDNQNPDYDYNKSFSKVHEYPNRKLGLYMAAKNQVESHGGFFKNLITFNLGRYFREHNALDNLKKDIIENHGITENGLNLLEKREKDLGTRQILDSIENGKLPMIKAPGTNAYKKRSLSAENEKQVEKVDEKKIEIKPQVDEPKKEEVNDQKDLKTQRYEQFLKVAEQFRLNVPSQKPNSNLDFNSKLGLDTDDGTLSNNGNNQRIENNQPSISKDLNK